MLNRHVSCLHVVDVLPHKTCISSLSYSVLICVFLIGKSYRYLSFGTCLHLFVQWLRLILTQSGSGCIYSFESQVFTSHSGKLYFGPHLLLQGNAMNRHRLIEPFVCSGMLTEIISCGRWRLVLGRPTWSPSASTKINREVSSKHWWTT